MTLCDIANLRLNNQQITGTSFKTAKEIISWMGEMQAQDFNMAKWGVGLRLPGSTEETINAAIDRGEIIRTHVMRPTWHFVSADDIYRMLELTAPNIRSSMKSRHKQLEIDAHAVAQSNAIIEKALTDRGQLSRKELVSEFIKAGIGLDDNRAAHLLMCAELDQLVCSGKTQGSQTTYALLAERVPAKTKMGREEALAKLALTYFSSHGPATLQDFVWWSGLAVRDARNALEMARSALVPETIGSQTYWFRNSTAEVARESVHLLPAFDEFIVGYKDRSAALTYEHHKKTVTNNGVFRPVVVVNGQVEGRWKRSVKKTEVPVEIVLFQMDVAGVEASIRKACEKFGGFLVRDTTLSMTNT